MIKFLFVFHVHQQEAAPVSPPLEVTETLLEMNKSIKPRYVLGGNPSNKHAPTSILNY